MLLLGNILWTTTGSGSAPPPPPPPAAPTIIPSGGIPAPATRTREDISRARERVGLRDQVSLAIEEVARRQAQRLELDKQKQFEELNRELELKGIEWDKKYLEALASERERLINAEIASRLKKLNQDKELITMLLLIAASE